MVLSSANVTRDDVEGQVAPASLLVLLAATFLLPSREDTLTFSLLLGFSVPAEAATDVVVVVTTPALAVAGALMVFA